MDIINNTLQPIGIIRSKIKLRSNAPKQGKEGAPDAWIDLISDVGDGIDGLTVGAEIIIITWLHQAQRDILKVRPRGDQIRHPKGVFATRSPDRPNPIGLHRVKILDIVGIKLKVAPLEAIDGTPVIDIKPVLKTVSDS